MDCTKSKLPTRTPFYDRGKKFPLNENSETAGLLDPFKTLNSLHTLSSSNFEKRVSSCKCGNPKMSERKNKIK